jgi:hypothetical protein
MLHADNRICNECQFGVRRPDAAFTRQGLKVLESESGVRPPHSKGRFRLAIGVRDNYHDRAAKGAPLNFRGIRRSLQNFDLRTRDLRTRGRVKIRKAKSQGEDIIVQ